MKWFLFFFTLFEAFLQSQGYTYCSYTYYSYGSRRTRHYRCSSSEYCCGTSSCCTMVYARWYLWFVLVTIFLVFFLIWWYYRYRYRPRQAVIRARPVLATTTTTGTTVTYPQAPGGYPQAVYPVAGYPQGPQVPPPGQPMYMHQGVGMAPYDPYGPQKGAYMAAPPSYESATAHPAGPAYPPPPPNNPR